MRTICRCGSHCSEIVPYGRIRLRSRGNKQASFSLARPSTFWVSRSSPSSFSAQSLSRPSPADRRLQVPASQACLLEVQRIPAGIQDAEGLALIRVGAAQRMKITISAPVGRKARRVTAAAAHPPIRSDLARPVPMMASGQRTPAACRKILKSRYAAFQAPAGA